MIIKKDLSNYEENGYFSYKPDEDFKVKCNTPIDVNKGGIYCIYRICKYEEELLYIGSSGQKNRDKTFKGRKSGLGGMKDRIVNGDHPKFKYNEDGKRIKRHKALPLYMKKENIEEIKIYWWITYDGILYFDFPTDIESQIRNKYKKMFDKIPDWHKKKSYK